nr:hemerythrin domain-containing protein [Paraburkholderia kururiensis]
MPPLLFPGSRPAASFDEPFEMLAACHGNAERMLRLLERLAARLAETGGDEAAQQAARDVVRYFDIAAPAHHEDEERHVFPALAAHGTPGQKHLVERLKQDHVEMSRRWQAIKLDLDQVINGQWTVKTQRAAGRAAEPAALAALADWAAFATLYRAHIEAEESGAYPAVQISMDDTARAGMSCEMARRRSVRWPPES